MDAASRWPRWIAIAYTTVWFGLSHPLLLAAGGQRQGTFGSTGLLRHSFHGHDLIRGLLENPQLAVAHFQPPCGRFAECERPRVLEPCRFGKVIESDVWLFQQPGPRVSDPMRSAPATNRA